MESFKYFEKLAWERKAAGYSDTWGTVTTKPMDAIIQIADICPDKFVLDCGCGPGQLTFLASQKGAKAIGCDYSHQMLQIAKANYPDLEFCHQDAEQLTFADNQFDIVILNYLLLHVENPDRALLEAKRVLKPTGTLVYTMWLPPNESLGLNLIFSAIKRHADLTVIPPAQDLFYYSSVSNANDFFTKNGFEKPIFNHFATEWKVHSSTQFFEAVQAGTRIGGLIELQHESIKEKIKNDILSEIEEFRGNAGYNIPTPSIIGSAKKL